MSIQAPQSGSANEDSLSSSRYVRLKPGPSQSQLEVVASQRARLQRAIIDLAARDGIDAVTVRRLTKLAGVSTGAFYSRFSGTDDCLLTAYREVMAGAARSITGSRSPDLGLADQLDRALRALLGRLLIDRTVARFALIEIYGGGPIAIAATGSEERRLASALGGCIDRRGRRVPEVAVAAIVAAVLHCTRAQLIDVAPEDGAPMIDALIGWATEVVEGKESLDIPADATSRPSAADSSWAPKRSSRAGSDEKDLIVSAILRLALPGGFCGLDPSKVSSAAGLPASRFRRHFATLADGYLAAIRRTAGSFFAEVTAKDDFASPPRPSIRAALHEARRRAASDPAAARLTFSQVIEPGIAGLTCREAMISELALACSDGATSEAAPIRVRAEARVAALWEALAHGARSAQA